MAGGRVKKAGQYFGGWRARKVGQGCGELKGEEGGSRLQRLGG